MYNFTFNLKNFCTIFNEFVKRLILSPYCHSFRKNFYGKNFYCKTFYVKKIEIIDVGAKCQGRGGVSPPANDEH